MKKIKIIALLLAAITVTAAFTGCGNTAPEDASGDNQPGTNQSATGDDTKAPAPQTTETTAKEPAQTFAPEVELDGLIFALREPEEFEEGDIGYYVSGVSSREVTEIIIPSECEGLPVIGIGSKAFKGCKSLTSITIPESVTGIGDEAFFGCESLTGITIPDGVTGIGHAAFDGCKSLTSITIPGGVKWIHDEVFHTCISLESITIQEGVTEIGYRTFMGCESLTSITLPKSMRIINDQAFINGPHFETIQYGGTVAEWEAFAEGTRCGARYWTVTCTDGIYQP